MNVYTNGIYKKDLNSWTKKVVFVPLFYSHTSNTSCSYSLCFEKKISIHSIPTFLQTRTIPQNIAHTMYDDHFAFYSVLYEYETWRQRISEWQLLYDDNVRESRVILETFQGISPNHKPLYLSHFKEPVLFQLFGTGVYARGAHAFHQGYGGYGSEKQIFWHFKNYYLMNQGLAHVKRQKTILLLNKQDKRQILNFDALVQAAKAEFGPEWNILGLTWESLQNHTKELELTLQTSIAFGMDGTGTQMLGFLPKGSVLISGGIWNEGKIEQLADFVYNMFDHIHVRYFMDYESQAFLGSSFMSPVIMPIPKLLSFIKLHLQLIGKPVIKEENFSPQGKACKLIYSDPEFFAALEKHNFNSFSCSSIRKFWHHHWRQLLPHRKEPNHFPKYQE